MVRAKSTDTNSTSTNNNNNRERDIVSMVKKQMITTHPNITPYNSNKTEDMINSTTPKDWYQFSNNDNDPISPYVNLPDTSIPSSNSNSTF